MDKELKPLHLRTIRNTSKEDRRQMVQEIIHGLGEGILDPRDIHLTVKSLEDLCKELLKDEKYQRLVTDHVIKFGKEHTYKNSLFTIRETGVTYDWKSAEDPVLEDLLRQQKELEQKIEARKNFLKTLPDGGVEIVAPDSGEITTIKNPIRCSRTSVVVNLK